MHNFKQLILVLVFLLVVFLIAEFTGLRGHFTLQLLRDKLADNLFTGLLIFVVLFALGNLLQIPGWIFLAAAVFALGPIAGGLATYFAATISCAFTYSVIKYVGGDAIRKMNNKTATKLLDHLNVHPVRNIALLRTLFQTLPAVNYALALSGVSFRQYMLGTILGLPLPIAGYCLFFSEVVKYLPISVGN